MAYAGDGIRAFGLAIVGAAGSIAEKKLIKSGEIIKRDKGFWKREEVFTTSTSPEDIMEEFSSLDTSSIGISKFVDKDEACGFIYQSNDIRNALFEARLKHEGQRNDKNTYCMWFTRWRTKNFTVQGQARMNMLLTLVEKAFAELDPETKIEIRSKST